MFGNLFMIPEVVSGVIGGADSLHIATRHQFLGAEIFGGKLGVALLVDFTGSGRVQDLVDAEDM